VLWCGSMSATNATPVPDPLRTLLEADASTLAAVDPFESSPRLAREQRINEIHRARRKLRRVAVMLAAPMEDLPAYRVWWGPCTRCGYIWLGRRLTLFPPIHCARCHSSAWQTLPARPYARIPENDPNPSWARWKARQDAEKRDARDKRRGTYVEKVYPPPPEPERRIDPGLITQSLDTLPEPVSPVPSWSPALVPFPSPPRPSGPVVPFPPPPRFSSLSERLREVTSAPVNDDNNRENPVASSESVSDQPDAQSDSDNAEDPPGDRTEDSPPLDGVAPVGDDRSEAPGSDE